MNALAALLLLTALTIPTSTLVLRSGERIDVDGAVRQEDGRVIFRSHGLLFSVPEKEVDIDATRAIGANITLVRADDRMRLKVTPAERDRLLRALEQNHNGIPASPESNLTVTSQGEASPPVNQNEWAWRQTARGYEEAVRRAKEELAMLYDRADKLKQEIRSLVNLGFRGSQFTYQTSQLELTYDQIPRAQLEVERAERALAQFREDARKQGIMPGWLR